MAQAKFHFSDVYQVGDGSVIQVDFRRGRRRRLLPPAEHMAVVVGGASILIALLATLLLIASVTRTLAEESRDIAGLSAAVAPEAASPAFDLAALHRVWNTDPAIRDFKGLGENDWDFERPDSIPGFGEIGPEVDIPQMVARILGGSSRVASASSTGLLR
jgi:hypothetical protein